MEFSYYVYENKNLNININRMPIWFNEVQVDGDESEGTITLHSQNEYDEVWGANAKMEITWEKKDRLDFFHYKEVQRSIDMYNAIKMVITKKEEDWIRSHEITFWYGHRKKIIRRKFYQENTIHGIFYCDISGRLISLHTAIIQEYFENFKPYILESYKSFQCH
ncbi:MAG: hypothetical protein GF317_04385 [Candidatus Lokiarchaeota archaeon]|nr:hypothetical protein [Candidatus Lokiarchaeota archaeon]MBD3199127.1 hypothetical protein [Candidatus Lokiarchaeota archaeon]